MLSNAFATAAYKLNPTTYQIAQEDSSNPSTNNKLMEASKKASSISYILSNIHVKPPRASIRLI